MNTESEKRLIYALDRLTNEVQKLQVAVENNAIDIVGGLKELQSLMSYADVSGVEEKLVDIRDLLKRK